MIKPQNDPNGALYEIYLELAGRFHPDVVKGPRDVAEARFQEIERAYEVMRDALREAPSVAAAPKQDQSGSLRQNGATVKDRRWNVEPFVIIAFLAVVAILLGYWIIDVWHRIADSSRWQTDPITMSNPPPQMPIAREQADPPQQLQDSSNFQPVPSPPPRAPATQPSGGSQLPGVGSLAQQPPSGKSDPPNARALRKHDSGDDRNSQVLKRRRARAFRANRLFAIDGCAYW
jgi:hypothetical protein